MPVLQFGHDDNFDFHFSTSYYYRLWKALLHVKQGKNTSKCLFLLFVVIPYVENVNLKLKKKDLTTSRLDSNQKYKSALRGGVFRWLNSTWRIFRNVKSGSLMVFIISKIYKWPLTQQKNNYILLSIIIHYVVFVYPHISVIMH